MQVSVHTNPPMGPAQCWGCGGASKSFYVDINLAIDFYGTFYLCNECFHQVAATAGYLSMDSVAKHIKEYVELQEENEKLRTENSTLRHALEVYLSMDIGRNVASPKPHLSIINTHLEQPDVARHPAVDKPAAQARQQQLDFGERTASESSNDEDLGVVRTIKSKSDSEFHFSL